MAGGIVLGQGSAIGGCPMRARSATVRGGGYVFGMSTLRWGSRAGEGLTARSKAMSALCMNVPNVRFEPFVHIADGLCR